MRKASFPFLGIIVQLVIALLLGMILYGYGATVIDGEAFAQEVHSLDAAMLAETLMIRDSGRANIYHFYEDNSYTLHVYPTTMRVQAAGETIQGGRSARYLHSRDATIDEQQATGRVLEWTWFDNELRVNSLSLEEQCPPLAETPRWSNAAVIGSTDIATRILETAYHNRGLNPDVITTRSNLGQVQEDLYLELRPASLLDDDIRISAGRGDYNARLLCFASRQFPEAIITVLPTTKEGMVFTAPSLRGSIQEDIVALLEEVVQ